LQVPILLKLKGFTQILLVFPYNAPEAQRGIIEADCHRNISALYAVRAQGYDLQNIQMNIKNGN